MDRIMNYLDMNLSTYVSFGLKVVCTILVFIIGKMVIKWALGLVQKSMQKMNTDKGVQQFTLSFLKCGMYVVLVTSIAVHFGLEPTSVAAILGSAGVAIGLALQGSLSNLAGGVLILLLKPFVVGDYIIEDSHKNEGIVKEIQIFYTKLQTVDNKIIVIPNGILANSSLTNVTDQEYRRLDFSVGISYDADLKKAKAILDTMLHNYEQIDQAKDILVIVEELADSAVMIGCKAWVKTTDYWNVRWDLLENIKLKFDEEGIEIPFNQLQVHLKQ